MFKPKPDVTSDNLRVEINMLIKSMSQTENKSSDEYAAMVKNLKEMYPLREVDSNVHSKNRIPPEVIATIAANLLGIAMVVGHERTAVITSQAIKMIRQLHR